VTDRTRKRRGGREPASERSAERAEEVRREEELEVLNRELTDLEEMEIGAEGVAGEGETASGTTPGSVGGTTGTAGHSSGIQSPGASAPPIRGIDPDEVRGKVGRLRPKDGE
jgi:hypothetical protein